MALDLPALGGKVTQGMFLRQSAGEGDLDGNRIFLSSTAGLGGFSLFVEVEKPREEGGPERVYVRYDLAPLVEEVAKRVLDADWKEIDR